MFQKSAKKDYFSTVIKASAQQFVFIEVKDVAGRPGDPHYSSGTKKRRRERGTTLYDEEQGFITGIGQLSVNKSSMEIYVHIKSYDLQKPMKRLNRWLVAVDDQGRNQSQLQQRRCPHPQNQTRGRSG